MTMPDERSRSIRKARDFLRSLLNPKETPKVPRAVRQAAGDVLKHFPGDLYIEESAKKLPDVWGKLETKVYERTYERKKK